MSLVAEALLRWARCSKNELFLRDTIYYSASALHIVQDEQAPGADASLSDIEGSLLSSVRFYASACSGPPQTKPFLRREQAAPRAFAEHSHARNQSGVQAMSFDIYAEITSKIVTMLEAGVVPWRSTARRCNGGPAISVRCHSGLLDGAGPGVFRLKKAPRSGRGAKKRE